MAENVKGQNRESNQENMNQEDNNQENNQIMPDSDTTSANSDHQNVSQNRGGTTDMGSDNQLRGAAGNTSRSNWGSGMSPKSGVTGSDFDGQVS
jgi:hypothetical protein